MITIAIAMTTIGMILVIGGILLTGLFLPGAVLIGLSMIAYVAAAILELRKREVQ